MIQEPFAHGASFIHQVDPRIRVVLVCIYSIVVALAHSFQVMTTAVLVSLSLIVLAQLSYREIIKRTIVLNSFNLLLWLVLPLTFRGPDALAIGPLAFYHAGTIMAAQITLKSNAIFMALVALATTMNFSTLGCALHWLHVPEKIVHLLLMTYRYVFVIDHEYRRLVRAVRIRGFQPGTNLHTYKTYAYIVGMLLVRSYARADRVYKAMLCRGFKHKFYCLHQFKYRQIDWLFGAAMGSVLVILIYLESR